MNRTRTARGAFALMVSSLIASLLASCGGSSSGSGGEPSSTGHVSSTKAVPDQQIRIGAIPYEDPSTELEQYTQFANFIGTHVNGKSGTATVATDYTGVITALEHDQIEIAYLNPLGYAIASDRASKSGHPLVPLAMPYVMMKGQKHGSLTYEGIIFTRADSGINSLKDLKGKTIAFNEPTSTSGYLYPFEMLLKAGVKPTSASEGGDLKQAIFAGAQGVVPAVFNRKVDAGAIFEEGIQISYPDPTTQAQFKVLARTPPIPNGMLVARGDLPQAEIQKIKQAIQAINTDPAGKKADAAMEVEKWGPPEDSLFNPVRETARVLKLDLKAPSEPSGGSSKPLTGKAEPAKP